MISLPPPADTLETCVVIPARDEEGHIGATLAALADQEGVAAETYEVLLVLDGCTDGTREEAIALGDERPALRLVVLDREPEGVGAARRAGMELALHRLLAIGRPDGLIATTDADTRVAPDWILAQRRAIGRGAQAVGGRILLDTADSALAGPAGLGAGWRDGSVAARTEAGAGHDAHPHFSGASLAVTAETYARVGGLPGSAALEDEAFERRLRAAGATIARPADVVVHTSARIRGRAPRGLARDLALADWMERRSYPPSRETVADLAARRTATVSVIVPAKEVAETVGGIVDVLVAAREAGLVDEVLVVDAASQDGTERVARAHGADVVQEDLLRPEMGRCRGKGDAMWRGISATSGEIVVFVDADSAAFSPTVLTSLLAPLFDDEDLHLVKGSFRRPFKVGDTVLPAGGGRVTELLARPLLNLHRPELGGFAQPLAGEIAARRPLLESLAFPVGYGVEIAMLLDAHDRVGLDGLAQADLGERQNRHQSLRELSAMALAVLVAAQRRLVGEAEVEALAPGPLALPYDGLHMRQVAVEERPPLVP